MLVFRYMLVGILVLTPGGVGCGGVLLALRGQRPQMLLNILQFTGQVTDNEELASLSMTQNVNSAKLEKPSS